ncbi:MAG: site-specific integrase [Oscillospiraceae bacterium]|jgi:integrase|nr:site-specific integrase [Oscillospiraceae bacterium]
MAKRDFGCIRKLPSGNFQAFYQGPDGIKHKAHTTFKKKANAEFWLFKERNLIEIENWTPPNTRSYKEKNKKAITFSDYTKNWIENRMTPFGKKLADNTLATYKILLDVHILPYFKNKILNQISVLDIKTWLENSDNSAPRSKQLAYSLMFSIMRSASFPDDEGNILIDKNPCTVKSTYKVKNKLKNCNLRIASKEELEKIENATPEKYRLMISLAAWCAMRSGEILELRRKDIDFKKNIIKIRRQVQHITAKGYVVSAPKSEAGIRNVSIPPHLIEKFKSHLEKFVEKNQEALIIKSISGINGYLSKSGYRTFYKKACKVAGCPHLRFHDLRHTGATYYAQIGATTKELMERIGHSTPEMTLRYQHVAKGRQQELAKRMSELFSS